MGTAYSYGSSSATAFDCSGFTQYVYKQHGINLPRTSAGQAGAGTKVSRFFDLEILNLKPGQAITGKTNLQIELGNTNIKMPKI